MAQSQGAARALNFAYGAGAAVVIAGALFKIMHWPFANQMLIAGMGTECLIFLISAFEKPHQDTDWSLVYPELAGMPGKEKEKKGVTKSATQQLDEMMANSKIGPELIDSLGTGLRSLSDNVGKMGDLTQASIATKDYATAVGSAATNMGQLTTAANEAVASVRNMTVSTEQSSQYHEQVQGLIKNLSALNGIYELELQDSNNHLKVMNKFYGSISQSLQSLVDASADAQKYKEEMARLTRNLTSLNTVYGNMLSAMAVAAPKAN
jgi:gliding motility-associated protein GldL